MSRNPEADQLEGLVRQSELDRRDPPTMSRNPETDQLEGLVRQSELVGGSQADEVIPLAEETLRADKREVVTGRVRVSTVTHQHEELVQQELAREDVEVTRVPIGREVAAVPHIRDEGGVTIIPILEEVLVVETRLVLKEEVHVRRTRSTEHIETPVVLRKQEAVVERLDTDDFQSTKETNT